jgi:glutaredoxin
MLKTGILWTLTLLGVLAAGTAVAQYKVVGPDGRVTYTDRPVPGGVTKPVGSAAAPGATAEELPYELRQVASRYPATLYTSANCSPCDSARSLLRQRGIPLREYSIERAEDLAELQRREGSAQLPILRLGAQRLQGFESGDWQATLDAAGYPRSSRLPPTWRATPAQPLVPEVAEPAARPTAPARVTAPAPVLPAASGSFRF